MAALTLTQARDTLSTRALSGENAFAVLSAIGRSTGLDDRHLARETLIRVLDQSERLPATLIPLLQSLIREHGLFPYLRDIESLSLADRLAFEAHRPDGRLGDEIVFHSEQSLVYERLLAGDNVVLSAPTSFGKSRVIDAYLETGGFTNASVIVPTIALMDETRRRLAGLSGPDGYKIITHASQGVGHRNLFVMTQERLLEYGNLPELEFFVIDEFYKLDPAHSDDRSNQLNVAFDRLRRTSAQFYLLGPNITALDSVSDRKLQATFISTDFTTVATDVRRVALSKDETADTLAAECRDAGPGTIVFCRSPKRVREVAGWLLRRDIGFSSLEPDDAETARLAGDRNQDSTAIADAADWVASTYHPDWIVCRALQAGIGIHHGRLPRALGHHMVRLFNEERLPYLLVTSTLIEGVNTTARNVIVLDHTIARKKYDYFTYANIRGRSGRMSRHFVGRVIIFNPVPQRAELNVDIPALSQSRNTSPEVLIHLPEQELTQSSRDRIAPYLDQDLVNTETLRNNRGVKLEDQMEAARTIQDRPRKWRGALEWNGSYPTAQQVQTLGELLVGMTGKSGVVRSAAQLGARINLLRRSRGDLRPLVQADLDYGKTVDDAMDDNFDFVRNYAQFKIPTALTAAASLASDVLGPGAQISNPGAFASALESMFQPRFATVLEEYGLPNATTLKLRDHLGLDMAEDLDDVLDRLREVDAGSDRLHPFEREMLRDTQSTL